MNVEITVSVLAALVAYRMLAPLVDALNPLAFLKKPKVVSAPAYIGMSGKRMEVEDPPKVAL